jgi:Right handed beta helix region
MPFMRHSAMHGPMHGLFVKPAFLFALGLGTSISTWAATYNVSADPTRAPFQSIQAAVNQARKGDEIVILDQAVYREQVTIDSNKAGLILRSANPTATRKPTILWQDQANVGPKSCQEALVARNINFDQNGALRLLMTRNIVVDGIAVDGGGRAPFAYAGVWGNGVDCNGQLAELFHGNAAITLFVSGDVTIRNCDIRNGYFGINVKDRNEGGVFANPNPADLDKWRVVPLSGFGKTGNHVFERNRIHNNSWGMFFESTWDMASTIRHNLIYSNFQLSTQAAAIKALPGGSHQVGGAIQFKDIILSPLAIYNNTFWNNFTIYAGHWKPGAQHLIFNNIYSKPHVYWNADPNFQNPFHVLDPAFTNRTYHSLYAAQTEALKLESRSINFSEHDQGTNETVRVDTTVQFYQNVRIMNSMGNPAQSNIPVVLTLNLSTGVRTRTENIQGIVPGALITGQTATQAFPASAGVRWFEVPFKSTDTSNVDFLVPDWDNPYVQQLILDKGWPDAGLVDADGSPADIGALPFGGVSTADLFIKPMSPVIITGTTGTFTFNVQQLAGNINNPTIKYFRWMNDIPVSVYGLASSFGGNIPPLPATTPLSAIGAVNVAGSTITATVPSRTATQLYAFAEIIITGTDAAGKPVTTNVGFLPFRKLDYKFDVKVYSMTDQLITTVKVGEPVKLRIEAQSASGTRFSNPVNPVEVNLNSGADLMVPGPPPAKLTFPTGITGLVAPTVMFTKVPAGGTEIIRVSGLWMDGSQGIAFLGTSEGIKILPGDPAKVVFQDPPSKSLSSSAAPTVDPGQNYNVRLNIYDAFDNKVVAPATVSIQSNNPLIGDIVGPKTAQSDSTGTVQFRAAVTTGDVGDTFELEAMITGKPSDKADLKVGKARDKLWILYSDAATGFDESVELRGSAGARLPVTIRAGQDSKTPLVDRTGSFTLEASSGLAVYASETATTTSNTFTLVAGQVVVYVSGLRTVNNGQLTATPTGDNTLLPDTRSKIFITVASVSVTSATYSANNGLGAVDRLDIVFGQALKAAPESLSLAWPTPGLNARLVTTGIALDPADAKHVIVTLATPFPAGITTGGGALGTVWVRDPAAPEEPAQQISLTIADAVGPLLDSGRVYEKLVTPGVDTLTLSFSEKLNPASLVGSSLLLLKANREPIAVNVVTATDLGNGQSFKLVIGDLGADAPMPGDSVRILATGPMTDALGNKAHALNRPIALKLKTVPRPPVLKPDFDLRPQTVILPPTLPDFLIFTPNGENQWKPVAGGQGSIQSDCVGNCGDIVTGVDGKIGRPAINVITDRGFKISVQIFSNTGDFVHVFQGEVSNADLGLDERGITTGTPGKYGNAINGVFTIKVAWNGKATSGQRAGTGAYIARYQVTALREKDDGTFVQVTERKDVRFGMLRGIP